MKPRVQPYGTKNIPDGLFLTLTGSDLIVDLDRHIRSDVFDINEKAGECNVEDNRTQQDDQECPA